MTRDMFLGIILGALLGAGCVLVYIPPKVAQYYTQSPACVVAPVAFRTDAIDITGTTPLGPMPKWDGIRDDIPD